MEDNYNVLEAVESTNKVRPAFLTVLCVITFIISGYYFVTNLISIFSTPNAEEISLATSRMEEMVEKMEDEGNGSAALLKSISDAMKVMFEHDIMIKMAILTLISSILCIIGAILMWKLQKKGYYIYLAGTAIYLILLPIILPNILGSIMTIFMGIFCILFLILYGVNLKKMTA